jgi:hypothetical protein
VATRGRGARSDLAVGSPNLETVDLGGEEGGVWLTRNQSSSREVIRPRFFSLPLALQVFFSLLSGGKTYSFISF